MPGQLKKCKHGKWTYSEIFEVSTYHCYHDTDPLGCYFINCQEDCPIYDIKEVV